MNRVSLVKTAFLHAALMGLYIVAISTFLSHTSQIFGPEEPKTVLVPIMMLSRLVFSAALMGSLIFARPILWYLDGRKREAVWLLVYMLGAFLLFAVGAFIVVFITLL